MKLRISFDEPLSEAVDLDVLVVEHEQQRQKYWLQKALVALGKGDVDTVRHAVKRMDQP